jgi:hypothetical protein
MSKEKAIEYFNIFNDSQILAREIDSKRDKEAALGRELDELYAELAKNVGPNVPRLVYRVNDFNVLIIEYTDETAVQLTIEEVL